MAQSTAGIKVWYGASTVSGGVPQVPSSWTEIPDITSIPSMGSAPAQLETTNIANTVMKTYIAGLMDLGGALEFGANMTPELVAAVAAATADPGSGKTRAFSITFPLPLGKRYWWTGQVEPVRPGEASVDAVATTTVYITTETEVAEVDFS